MQGGGVLQGDLLARPTGAGWGFLLFVLVTLLGCMNYQLSLGYFLSFLLLSVWVGCFVQSSRGLTGVRVTVQSPDRFFAGEQAVFSAVVEGARGRSGALISLHLHHGWMDVPANTRKDIPISFALEKRGPGTIPSILMHAMDPLGLFVLSRVVHPPQTVVVYPSPEPTPPPWEVSGNVFTEGVGRVSGSEEFKGLRPYLPGDPMSRVLWRRVLPDGTLLTKEFDAPGGGQPFFNVVALSRQLGVEAALSRVTAWVLAAEQLELEFTVKLPEAAFTGRGRVHADRSLRALAGWPGKEPSHAEV